MTRSRMTVEAGAVFVAERVRGRAGDGNQHVDAVEQRSRQPALVARQIGGRAAARLVAHPAGARVRRGDEHEPRREDDDLLPTHDGHVPVLERLAQRLEARAHELRQLVEEEDAVVGECRLAGLRMRAAADEP
jgi:hypothetical protein